MTEENKSAPAGDMRVLIEQIAKALVDDPAQVSVNPVEEGGETVLELTVGPNDLGRVIGKQGRTARAMRNLLGAAGLKFNKRYHAGDSGIADEFITLARVLKTQGRHGEVATELHSDIPDRFHQGMRLWALTDDGSRRELEVEEFWPHKSYLVLKFAGSRFDFGR